MGSLIYVMIGIRLNIAYAILIISRYSSNPNKAYYRTLIRIFKYLKGIRGIALLYEGNVIEIIGFINVNWGRDYNTKRFTLRYIFYVGSVPVNWSFKR